MWADHPISYCKTFVIDLQMRFMMLKICKSWDVRKHDIGAANPK